MSLYEDLKAAATALHRLSQVEKALIQAAASADGAVDALRRDVTELRERMIRIEARLDAIEELSVARMQAIVAAAIASVSIVSQQPTTPALEGSAEGSRTTQARRRRAKSGATP